MRAKTTYLAAAAALLLPLLLLAGCFKKVSNTTTFIIKPALQLETNADYSVAQGVRGYACYTGERWTVESYDDAVSMTLTDTETGETKSAEPKSETEPYDDGETEGLLKMKTTASHVLLVLIYDDYGMYAYRHYNVAENLPRTWLTVQFCPWKKDRQYKASDWIVGHTPAAEPEPEPEPDDDTNEQ